MSLPIHVDAYSGYRANERPMQFQVDEELFEINEVEDRWYDPSAEYFKFLTTDGKRYVLRYSLEKDDWTIQAHSMGQRTPIFSLASLRTKSISRS